MGTKSIIFWLVATMGVAFAAAVATAQPYTIGWNEDFESGLTDWVQDNNDDMNWTVDSNGTTSSSTGPSVDHNPGTSLGDYIYLETSSGVTGDEAILIGPVLDLNTATAPGLDVWYHMYGSTMGSFHVDGLGVELAGSDGAVNSTNDQFSSASVTFAAGDVGEYVAIGAGPNAGLWEIITFVDSNTVVLDFGTYFNSTASSLDFNQGPLTTDLFMESGDQGDVWLNTVVPIAAYKVGTQRMLPIMRGTKGTSYYSDMAFDDISLVELPIDVGVSAITAPTSGFGLTATESVTIEITAYGLAAASIPVSYTVTPPTGPPVTVNETWTGTLNPGATTTYTFTATVDMTASGVYVFDASTALTGDATAGNDGITGQNVLNLTWPYYEDFEATDGGWVTGGTSSSWQWGAPAGLVINTPPPSGGVNSWMTNLTGNYNNSENSYIESPNFDLSFTAGFLIEFDIWYETEFSFDGASLWYSLDNGATWVIVGAYSALDPSWYNDNTITGLSNATGNGEGFSGSSPGWIHVSREIPAVAGQSSVIFRIWFGSETSVWDDGVAIDNIAFIDPGDSLFFSPGPAGDNSSTIDPATATDMLVQGYNMTAYVQSHDLTDLSLTLTGTAVDADVQDVKLWIDNGDNIFNTASDTQLGTAATFTAGVATFTALAHTVALGTPELLWVSASLSATATPGATFGVSIAADTDVTVTPGDANGAFPLLSPTFSIFGRVTTLPWTENFDGNTPYNMLTDVGPGDFPTADQVTLQLLAPATYAAAAQVTIGDPTTVAPASAPNHLGIDFPNSDATGAADFYFDLSAYSVNSHLVTLTFDVADRTDENDDEDHVFISVDGGVTWVQSLYFLDHASRSIYETIGPINVSDVLAAAGVDFTNDVVFRFQSQDNSSFSGGDGALFDNIQLDAEIYPIAEVGFNGSPVLSGTALNVGEVQVATAKTLSFTLENTGGLDLVLGTPPTSIQLVNGLVVANVQGPVVTTLTTGVQTTFSVQYAAATSGAFEFNIVLHTNDPGQEQYLVGITGTAAVVKTPSDDVGCCGATNGDSANGGPLAVLLMVFGLVALTSWRRRVF